ncbi:TNC [Linum perenne]
MELLVGCSPCSWRGFPTKLRFTVVVFEVAVDGKWKVCPRAGGPVLFPGFNGELVCPAYQELCSTSPVLVSGQCPKSCNFNGDCVDGRCLCFLGYHGHDCSQRACPGNCNGNGKCLGNGVCKCGKGYTGVDCSTGAPSESSILQQLEEVVVMPNYHRLFPGGARKLFNLFGSSYCDAAAKRLACWISIQKCDKDGDNRLRVCHSACMSYNSACGASLDCSDQTLFSSKEEGEGQCTGVGEMKVSWLNRMRITLLSSNTSLKGSL